MRTNFRAGKFQHQGLTVTLERHFEEKAEWPFLVAQRNTVHALGPARDTDLVPKSPLESLRAELRQVRHTSAQPVDIFYNFAVPHRETVAVLGNMAFPTLGQQENSNPKALLHRRELFPGEKFSEEHTVHVAALRK
jgi:hypothetical protein